MFALSVSTKRCTAHQAIAAVLPSFNAGQVPGLELFAQEPLQHASVIAAAALQQADARSELLRKQMAACSRADAMAGAACVDRKSGERRMASRLKTDAAPTASGDVCAQNAAIIDVVI
jgi:hypothetical protein